MPDTTTKKRFRAIQMLVLATLFWGLSFPVMKALLLAQQELLPGCSTWALTALSLAFRFGCSALILVVWHARALRTTSRAELRQGLGLGVFGAAGLLLQMDGLAFTSASTSAFLTQFYCILIPLWTAYWRHRPSRRVLVSCVLVMIGAAIISRFDWRDMRLGRGEAETLASSVLFSGQILWLERPSYRANHMGRVSTIMFFIMTVVGLAQASLTVPRWEDFVVAFSRPPILAFLAILVVFCTLGGYLLMNYWQPHVTATEAGLIYCAEPVFASAYALFLPAWLSAWAGLHYANEVPTFHLLAAAGLNTFANHLMQTGSSHPPPGTPADK